MTSKNEIINEILFDNVVAIPTDTVYGLVAKLKKENITLINSFKKRTLNKPLQILVNNIKQIESIWIGTSWQRNYINENLDFKTSFIVEVNNIFSDKYLLTSFNNTIMFRVTNKKELIEIINEVGPLFATSANITGEQPLNTKEDIEKKFNIRVLDGKIDGGKPSKIISLLNDIEKVVR